MSIQTPNRPNVPVRIQQPRRKPGCHCKLTSKWLCLRFRDVTCFSYPIGNSVAQKWCHPIVHWKWLVLISITSWIFFFFFTQFVWSDSSRTLERRSWWPSESATLLLWCRQPAARTWRRSDFFWIFTQQVMNVFDDILEKIWTHLVRRRGSKGWRKHWTRRPSDPQLCLFDHPDSPTYEKLLKQNWELFEDSDQELEYSCTLTSLKIWNHWILLKVTGNASSDTALQSYWTIQRYVPSLSCQNRLAWQRLYKRRRCILLLSTICLKKRRKGWGRQKRSRPPR